MGTLLLGKELGACVNVGVGQLWEDVRTKGRGLFQKQ